LLIFSFFKKIAKARSRIVVFQYLITVFFQYAAEFIYEKKYASGTNKTSMTSMNLLIKRLKSKKF